MKSRGHNQAAEYRHMFVSTSMLAVSIVVIAMLALFAVKNSRDEIGRLRTMLDLLTENMGEFPEATARANTQRDHDPEAPFRTRFFTVFFDGAGEITSINLDNIAAVDEAEAEKKALAAISGKKTEGWNENYIFRKSDSFVVFLNASEEIDSMHRFVRGSAGVALACIVAMFLLLLVLSRLATRPISESLEKQRQFITDASHELKTPLTIISANSEILEMNFGENEWTESISKQVMRMSKLISSLVSLTRIDEGGFDITLAVFDLSEAVEDTALSFSAAAQARGLKLETDVVSDVFFNGDEAALRQLMSILMDNAVKYTDTGGLIRVKLSLGARHAAVTVSNAYSRRPRLNPDRLFDRFVRADEARTGNGSYGLGLSIARSIVVSHGGQIKAAADGETFSITVRLSGNELQKKQM